MEEITPLQVHEMTREQAQELWNERQMLIGRIRAEMDLLRGKIWPGEPKIQGVTECQAHLDGGGLCGSKNLRFRTNGTYFCGKCGFSSGDP